ncbi:HD family phosphohydrolase [Priestia flexa]|uniref:HD family phosphohydrolase n=2 Tax=Priestia flexa TaxID=86664 RepID=A0A8I1MDU1_9BACI|nr:HD family phosphohydrolase [Priestia flexa]MBN8250454.1 HD family phosphohydrolase [Priestia flexa]MBN8432724.1 HD family phosphohydrolase [Priestia flexa]MCA0965290.1 HD family phosphohydrolase [Priestia flexa]RIV09159.1 HDIG domain-containing protein [Priestia flexa]UIR32260.1 HD family phosphohydrolase [Priestia flexa]
MFASMYSNVKPEELDLRLLSISPETIYSPVTIEDKESTEKKKAEAKEAVEDVYTQKTEYAQNQVDLVASIFDAIIEVNKEYDQLENKSETSKQEMLQDKLPDNIRKGLSDKAISELLQTNKEELSVAKDAVVTAVHHVMKNQVMISDLEEMKDQAEGQLVYTTNVSSSLKAAMNEIARSSIIPNVIYDPQKTSENRQAAVEKIEPVRIKQGQIIVEENQLINADIYRQLQLAGLLNNKGMLQPFIGLSLLIIIMIGGAAFYLRGLHANTYKPLLLYAIITSITIALMKILSFFQRIDLSEIGYLAPVAVGGILLRVLMNEKIAIISSIIFAICGSIIFNGELTTAFNMNIGIYFLISNITAILFLMDKQRKARVLQAGLVVALMNVIVSLSIIFIKNGQLDTMELGYYSLMAMASGIISSVLAIGLLPFFESGFGILSTMKLIELSSPNHPLLRKILTETPGTYHHSVMVANLSEAACETIGANGLLARVGAYYHDIGKTKRPQYFIENQMNIRNPHDALSPKVSKNIITSHTTDGAAILRKHKLPKEIVDIAEQHHGTSLLKFFYHKALEQTEEEIKEEDYRYEGPKPQTKEAAVICIADSVEAAVRSMPNPTPEKIEKLVRSIINDRVEDEQFIECDITLKELELIRQALCETLNGIFHSRIEYPELKKQKVKA